MIVLRRLFIASCAGWLLALLSSTFVLVGCGSVKPSADLTGVVSVDDQPVADGQITFTPLDGPGVSVSTKIEQGKFRATGVAIGKVRADLNAVRETGKIIMPNGFPEKEIENVIPGHYASGIVIQVEAGPGTHDFLLKSKP